MSLPFPESQAGARTPLPRLLLSAFLAVCVIAVAALAFPASVPAQETITIRGTVDNGTAGAEAPADLGVLMLITGPDGTLQSTDQTVQEPDGRFRFEDVPVIDGGVYNLSVDYGGIFYGRSLSAEQLLVEVVITVHETTADATIMTVQRQVMVISEIDVGQRLMSATEFVRFTNPTDRTLQPNLETARPGMFSFMRFALPPDAADVTVQSNLRGGEVISVGSGFALAAPVPPGEHSVDFAYTFPYEGGSLDYRNSLPQGAEIFQILVPEQWADMEIGGLTRRDPVGIGSEVYQAWEARDVPAGPGVQLAFSGLPQPGVIARLGTTLSSDSFWATAIPSAMGAVLLALLILGLIRRYRPVSTNGTSGDLGEDPQTATAASQRASLVASLAELDERYQRGAIAEDDYLEGRATLVARALGETTGSEE